MKATPHKSHTPIVPESPHTIGENIGEMGTVWVVGVEELASRLPVRWKDGKRFQRAVLVLGLIIKRSILFRKEWVPITGDFVYELAGKEDGREILQILAEAGAIDPEKGWVFRRGRPRPKRYRVSGKFASLRGQSFQIQPELWQRYQTQRIRRRQRSIDSHEGNKAFWDDLQHLSLHPDYVEQIPRFSASEWKKRMAWSHTIHQIRVRDFDFADGNRVGRIYTTFCSTPSLLRRYALLDGHSVVGIDVKCSQPFLHGSLIGACDEKDRFMASVLSGRFYEDLADAAGIGADIGRDTLKTMVFREVFYGRTRYDDPGLLWMAFQRLYPQLASAIVEKKRADYRALSVEMQDLESDIILRDAVPALRQAIHGIRLLTVHDALYVHPQHVDTAKAALKRAFLRHTGYSPALALQPSAIARQ